MTKKETAIFEKYYNKHLSVYMACVVKGETVPDSLVQRVCVLSELRVKLFSPDLDTDENQI